MMIIEKSNFSLGLIKMIEAVNSTLAQASIAKAPLESGSSLASFASDENQVKEVAEAPYVSPTVKVDPNTKIAILEFRESSSGDVLLQVPSEQQIRAYQANRVRKEAELEAKLQTNGSSSAEEVEVSEAQIEREVQAAQNASGSGASQIVFSSEE
jgi:hypothetical protein